MDAQGSASQEIVLSEFDTFLTAVYKDKKAMSPQVKLKILIAEDYEDNRELLRVLLSSANYAVHETSNGQQCLEMARELKPDLIMVDLSMPVLDGWELFRELRSDASTATIPCVAITAHGEYDRERALAAGFNGYLSKPFRSSDLFDLVKSLVRPASTQDIH
jgi:CheY-like chemotaxis protein